MMEEVMAEEVGHIAVVKSEIGLLAFYLRSLLFGFRKFFAAAHG